MLDMIYLITIGIITALTVVFFYQIRRIWRIRVIIKNFLQELKKLNKNVDHIITYINGNTVSKDGTYSSESICKNCLFRLTYPPELDSAGIFTYRCKFDQRSILLTDTCRRFQKDLLNTQI